MVLNAVVFQTSYQTKGSISFILSRSFSLFHCRYLLRKLKLDRIKESRDKSVRFTNEFGLTKDTTSFRKEHEVRVLRSLILDPMHWVEIFVFSASANTANAVNSFVRTHYAVDNRPPSFLRRMRSFVLRENARKPLADNEKGRMRLSRFNMQLQQYCTLAGFQSTELSAAHPAMQQLGLEIKEVPMKAYTHIRWINTDLDPPPHDHGIEHYNNNVVLYFIAMRCMLSPLDGEFISVDEFTASLGEFAALRGDVDSHMGATGEFAIDPSDLVTLDVSQDTVFIRELVGLRPKEGAEAAERRLKDQVRPCADFVLVVLHTVMIALPGAVLVMFALMMQTEFVKLNPSTCSTPCDNGGVPYMTLDLLWQAPQLWYYRDTMPWNYVAYGVALLITVVGACQMFAYHSGMSQLKDMLTASETTLLSGSRLNGDLKCLDDVRELMLESAIQPPVLFSKAHDISVAARLLESERRHMRNGWCCTLLAYIAVGALHRNRGVTGQSRCCVRCAGRAVCVVRPT